MKKINIGFSFLITILSLLYLGNIHSAEDKMIELYFNEIQILEDSVKNYQGPINACVKIKDPEFFSSLEIEVKLHDQVQEIELQKDVQNLTTTFILEEGVFDIRITVDQHELVMDDILIYQKIPIEINGEPLQSAHHFDQTIQIKTEKSKLYDYDSSYIVINNERFTWTQNETTASYVIEDEGQYHIEFHFVDWQGNEIVEKTKVIKEFEIKQIDFTYSSIPQTVDTRMFFSENIQIKINIHVVDINNIRVLLNNQEQTLDWKQDEVGYSTLLKIIQEGYHTIDVFYGDTLLASPLHDFSIILDKTKPEVQLQTVMNTNNTNQDVEVKIHTSDSSTLTYEVQIKKNDKLIQSDKDEIDKTYLLHEDVGTNIYTLQAWAKDIAGNETMSNEIQVIIDKEEPRIQSFLQQKSYQNPLLTNQSIQLEFTWQDDFIAQKKLFVYKNDQLVNEQVLQENSFVKTIPSMQMRSDQYRYILQASDVAGNMSEASMEFTMDTYLEVLQIKNDIFHGQPKNSSWTPEIEDVNEAITILNTKLLKDQKEQNYEWGTPIMEDGEYLIQIMAQDAAGNIAQLEKPFKFTIDQTIPEIHMKDVYGKEIQESYMGSGLEIMIDTGILKQDDLISVTLNGKEQLSKKVSNLKIPLTTTGDYDIQVIAEDKAGNIAYRNQQFHILSKEEPQYAIWFAGLGGLVVAIFMYVKCR